MSNPVYKRCPECGGIRHKKVGKPKQKRYQCLKCGCIVEGGKTKRTVIKHGREVTP